MLFFTGPDGHLAPGDPLLLLLDVHLQLHVAHRGRELGWARQPEGENIVMDNEKKN